jgi:hypothetical protein
MPKGNTVTSTVKKTAAARKTAASEQPTSTETPAEVGDGADSGADSNDESTAARSARDAGPGTGTPAQAETAARPPATIVNETAAAPLDPPADTPTQTQPPLGHAAASTNHVYAAAGGQTFAGEAHRRFINAQGDEIDPDEMFEEVEPRFTYVIAKERIREEFTYRNSKQADRRLLYPAGAHVPRAEAAGLVAAAKAAQDSNADSE